MCTVTLYIQGITEMIIVIGESCQRIYIYLTDEINNLKLLKEKYVILGSVAIKINVNFLCTWNIICW